MRLKTGDVRLRSSTRVDHVIARRGVSDQGEG